MKSCVISPKGILQIVAIYLSLKRDWKLKPFTWLARAWCSLQCHLKMEEVFLMSINGHENSNCKKLCIMTMLRFGNVFHITGSLWMESTGKPMDYHHKASNSESVAKPLRHHGKYRYIGLICQWISAKRGVSPFLIHCRCHSFVLNHRYTGQSVSLPRSNSAFFPAFGCSTPWWYTGRGWAG